MTRGRITIAALVAVLAAVGTATATAGIGGDVLRGGGIQLAAPTGWGKVEPPDERRIADPRTILVVGSKGVHAVESPCQVAAYHVPADGAVVVVIGWRGEGTVSGLLPLSGLKLRRGTFQCYTGRGAVAQLTRGGRDFQVNVMVGDRADAETVADAMAVARSLAVARRA